MKLLRWIKSHKLISTLIAICILLGIPCGIHVLFKIHTGIPFLEAEWSAGDVLGYYGSVLSFLGSAAVSLIVVFLSQHFTNENRRQEEARRRHEKDMQYIRGIHEREMQQRKLEEQRRTQVQPIFSVKIVGIDKQVDGTVEAIRDFKHSGVKHKNFKIEITNAGAYPIKHVIVFETYKEQLLGSGDSISMQCAFSDSPDIQAWPDKLIELPTGEYNKGPSGLPKEFNICYEDIDGRSMQQIYDLKNFGTELYYSSRRTETIEE